MSERDDSSWIDRVSAALSAFVPLGFALARVEPSSSFRDDLPLVRGLGLVGTAGAGGVTTLLVQLATLIPMGPLPFRAAMVSAIALGASGLVVYALAKGLLLENLRTTRLAPPLAAMAALLFTLAPSLQREATLTGGATVALLLGATTLLVKARGALQDLRAWLALGAALGASFVESLPLGLGLSLAIAAYSLVTTQRPSRRKVLAATVALFSTSGFLLLPWVLRPLAPRAAYDLGRTLGSLDSIVADVAIARPQALAVWTAELGLFTLALAGLGASVGLLRRRLRPLVVALLALVLLDIVLPKTTEGLLSGDILAPLHAMALLGFAIVTALGVQTGATKLLAMKTQMGAAAAILLVTFHLALVAMAAETAFSASPKRSARGAEAWTAQAFERLPPRSTLLVRSRAMAWRLWAAKLSEGSRPDVLVVPAALLSQGRIASTLLEREPALSGLLRDLSIEGRPGEASLTTLADARPLLVELDPSWDHRLVSHLVAERLWLRFAPQPLGRSDREQAFEVAHPRFEAVKEAATLNDAIDPATSALLAAQLRGQAASAGVMGDRDAAFVLLERLSTLVNDDPFVTELSHRLAEAKSGIRLEGLLR